MLGGDVERLPKLDDHVSKEISRFQRIPAANFQDFSGISYRDFRGQCTRFRRSCGPLVVIRSHNAHAHLRLHQPVVLILDYAHRRALSEFRLR